MTYYVHVIYKQKAIKAAYKDEGRVGIITKIGNTNANKGGK